MDANQFYKPPNGEPLTDSEREIIYLLAEDKAYQYGWGLCKGDRRSKKGEPNIGKIACEIGRPDDTVGFVLHPWMYDNKLKVNRKWVKSESGKAYMKEYNRQSAREQRERLKERSAALGIKKGHGLSESEERIAVALAQVPEYRLKAYHPGTRPGYAGRPSINKIANELGRSRQAVEKALQKHGLFQRS